MSETGWLIEHPHDPRYGRESWYAGKDGFTIDSLQAIRYARQEDAEKEIDRFPLSLAKNLRATDHAWCGPTPGVEEMYPMAGQSFVKPLDEVEVVKAKMREAQQRYSDDLRRLELLYDNERFLRSRDLEAWTHQAKLYWDGEEQRKKNIEEINRLGAAVERLECSLKERDDQTNHAIRVNREEAGQAGYDRALCDIGYTISIGMIAAERRRQVEGESWTSMHDDGHDAGQLALAAACYAIESAGKTSVNATPLFGLEVSVDIAKLYWPWEHAWWKPTTPLHNLVKAGALIAAEIDRLLRAAGEDGR